MSELDRMDADVWRRRCEELEAENEQLREWHRQDDGLHRRLAELAYDTRGCRGDMPGVCCPACAIEVGEDDSPETMRAAIDAFPAPEEWKA